jgi:diacylglycerol kinase (ATP)
MQGMANQNTGGWGRIVRAFGYSMQGFKACYEQEEAFRQEVWAIVPLFPLGIWLGETPLERAVLVGSLLIVPIVELLNSAIEANVDRVGLERHELSGRAKDIASAAVFLSIVFAAVVWGAILVPKWV